MGWLDRKDTGGYERSRCVDELIILSCVVGEDWTSSRIYAQRDGRKGS